MELYPITAADLDGLEALEALCFADPWPKEALAMLLEEGRYAVISREDGRICGYGAIQYVLDEGEVVNIATHPDMRGRGIGGEIMAELLRYAREVGLTYITLEVRVSNETARRLYERNGFAPLGLRKKFYAHPSEDAIVMGRTL